MGDWFFFFRSETLRAEKQFQGVKHTDPHPGYRFGGSPNRAAKFEHLTEKITEIQILGTFYSSSCYYVVCFFITNELTCLTVSHEKSQSFQPPYTPVIQASCTDGGGVNQRLTSGTIMTELASSALL